MTTARRAMLALALLAGLALPSLVGAARSRDDGPSPAPAARAAPRFVAVALRLDSGAAPLAAWQVALTARHDGVRIVGIEGAPDGAFREPAAYDPAALAGGRIVLAAFSTAPAPRLASGAQVVAVLHLVLDPGAEPAFDAVVIAAGDPDATRIPVALALLPPAENAR